jgi:hypothetical protein
VSQGGGVYYVPVAISSNPLSLGQGGLCLLNGAVMKICHLNVDNIATAADYSFLYDYVALRMYIKLPSNQTPSQAGTFQLTTSQVLMALGNNVPVNNVLVDGITLAGASTHGLTCSGSNIVIQNCNIQFCGGNRQSTGNWLGNGIFVGSGSSNVNVVRSFIQNCYDYAVSLQASSGNIDIWQVRDNVISNCGAAGIDVSCAQSDGAHSRGTVSYNTISSIGVNYSSWANSRNYTGTGIQLSRGGSSGSISNITVDSNTVRNCREGFYAVTSATIDVSNVSLTNNKFLCPTSQGVNAIHLAHLGGTPLSDVHGNVIQNWAIGVFVDQPFSLALGFNNNSFINNNQMISASSSSYGLVCNNNLYQGNAQVLNIAPTSMSSSNNYFAGNGPDGSYTRGTGDADFAAVSFDSVVTYMPVSGSAVFSGGSNLGISLRDANRNFFGNGFPQQVQFSA